MKCAHCSTEIAAPKIPSGCSEVTIVCPSCGTQLDVSPRWMLGFKLPKLTIRTREVKNK